MPARMPSQLRNAGARTSRKTAAAGSTASSRRLDPRGADRGRVGCRFCCACAAGRTPCNRPCAGDGRADAQARRAEGIPVRAAERHAGRRHARSPRAGRHADDLVSSVGAVDDPPGIGGLAHFFEHMMFRGTNASARRSASRTPSRAMAARTTPSPRMTTPPSTNRSPRTACGSPWRWRPTAWPISIFPTPMSRTERDVVLEERRMRVDNDPQALIARADRSGALSVASLWPAGDRLAGRGSPHRPASRRRSSTIIITRPTTRPDRSPATSRRTKCARPREADYGKLPARELVPRCDYRPTRRGSAKRDSPSRGRDAKVPLFMRALSRAELCRGDARPGRGAGDAGAADGRRFHRRRSIASWWSSSKLATDAGASYDGYARDAGEFTVYAVPRPGVSLDSARARHR